MSHRWSWPLKSRIWCVHTICSRVFSLLILFYSLPSVCAFWPKMKYSSPALIMDLGMRLGLANGMLGGVFKTKAWKVLSRFRLCPCLSAITTRRYILTSPQDPGGDETPLEQNYADLSPAYISQHHITHRSMRVMTAVFQHWALGWFVTRQFCAKS